MQTKYSRPARSGGRRPFSGGGTPRSGGGASRRFQVEDVQVVVLAIHLAVEEVEVDVVRLQPLTHQNL